MSKEMISIPEGSLLRLAETKSITTLSALKEKTGVDRKTLRAINAGQPVKKTTLQFIADKLRLPITHLLASNAADKTDVRGGDDYQYGEIKLQQLDSAALRKLAGETDEITWFLNVERMPLDLEFALTDLRRSLKQRFLHLSLAEDPDDLDDNLLDAISYVKTSDDIDKSIEELARHKLKIFGGTYIAWKKIRPFQRSSEEGEDPNLLPILLYNSELKAALSIAPENKSNPTVRVGIGWVPPREFIESKLVMSGLYLVKIDGALAWSREDIDKEYLEQLNREDFDKELTEKLQHLVKDLRPYSPSS